MWWFRRGKQESVEVEVYCQNCGHEITQAGGYVTGSGKIYCRTEKNSCLGNVIEQAARGIDMENLFIYFYNARSVQELIGKKALVYYGQLEQRVSDSEANAKDTHVDLPTTNPTSSEATTPS